MTAASGPPPTLSLQDRVVRDPEAMSAEIDGEAVALDVANGACFGFDTIATHVWALMASPITVADICVDLMTTYEVEPDTCQNDVLDLLQELHAEGLIRLAPVAPPAAA